MIPMFCILCVVILDLQIFLQLNGQTTYISVLPYM